MTLEPGATLGRYQILEPLGQGGMATVYRAFQPALERVVALKVMRAELGADAEFVSRFRREAKAIARLRHPHIVDVFDFDEDAGRYFLAMEYLEGGTLKAKLAELAGAGQRLPQPEAARIIGEIAEALRHAHGLGVVHRDIKPSNIMLTGDGRVVVSDFGIAKILAATRYTQTGVGIGTPEYMSPEQCQGHEVDERSDIYSLGIVAYELLTGRVPFTADTPLAIALMQIRDPLPLPSKVNPSIGAAAEQALLRALAKAPGERFASVPEFGAALSRAVVGAAVSTVPTVVVQPKDAAAPARPAASSGALLAPAPGAARRPARALSLLAGAGLTLVAAVVLLFAFLLRPYQSVSPAPTSPLAATSLVTASPVPTVAAGPRVVRTIRVGGSPDGVGINPALNRVYVTNQSSDSVSIIDGATHSLLATIAVGRRPAGLGVNPVTNRIYVANFDSNTVSIIDGATNAVAATITVGSGPADARVDAMRNRIYIANFNANTVSVIDGGTNVIVASIPVGRGPTSVAVHERTNRVYVANFNANTVSVIDTAANAVVATIPTGSGPAEVRVNAATNRVYVANRNSDTVSVIDGAGNVVVATVAVGKGPRGLAVDPTQNRVYVANADSNTVSVVDGASNAVVASIAVGSAPAGVNRNQTTRRIYVANFGSDTVSVIE